MSKILKGIFEAPPKDIDVHRTMTKSMDLMTPDKYSIVDGAGRYVGDIYDSYADAEQALSKLKNKYAQVKIVKLPEKNITEDLRKWFKEKWVRFGPDGKIRGNCARGDDSEGKPKCLPQSKAHSLGKKGRASAAARKRREDPNPERSGKAINVATKKKSNEGLAEGSGPQKGDPVYYGSRLVGWFLGYSKYGKVITEPNYDEMGDEYANRDVYWDEDAVTIKSDKQGVAEDQLDELKCWSGYTRVKGVPAGAPGSCKKKTDETVEEGWEEDAKKLGYEVKSASNGKHAYRKTSDKLSHVGTKNKNTSWLYHPDDKGQSIKKDYEQDVKEEKCPHCAGPMFSEELMMEKKDACYYKVKSRYKVWPSAYASGALVKCRKKGAKNWGTKSESAIMRGIQNEQDIDEHNMMTTQNVDATKFVPGVKVSHNMLGRVSVVKIQNGSLIVKDSQGKQYRISLTSVR